jgi:flagellar basal body-associated protein FliL
MDILIVQVFVSLLLVVGGVVALAYSVKQEDHQHADRLSILPLEDDQTTTTNTTDPRETRGATTNHL